MHTCMYVCIYVIYNTDEGLERNFQEMSHNNTSQQQLAYLNSSKQIHTHTHLANNHHPWICLSGVGGCLCMKGCECVVHED